MIPGLARRGTKSKRNKFMTSDVNFDELSVKTTQTNAIEDFDALFGAAFALSEWHFISRGELPDVYPYVASNAQYADNQPMIRAFTDTNRLLRFARENNLTGSDGSANILTIPTANIVDYLEGFIAHGAYGIWFNSDTESDGFFIPLKQLRPIKEHLAKLNPPQTAASKPSVETLQFVVKEGLMLPSADIIPAPYTTNLFWRMPSDWVSGEEVKAEHLRKIEREMSGGRSENIEGAFYVVTDYSTKVFEPEKAKNIKWSDILPADDDNVYMFFIASANGEIRKVSATEFQADVDASFGAATTAEARKPQDNLANFGMSQTADGDFDLNLTINQVGAVDFDASIAPFFETIVPLLNDFQGSGDYETLLRFEPAGISDLSESNVENARGAYLQIRRFHYLNPKNNTRIGVSSIHSRRLRHVRSNAELIVSFELCKNLDNRTAAFYFRFEGSKSDVLRLMSAIEPRLANCGYRKVG